MSEVFLAVHRGLVGFTKLVVVKRLRDDMPNEGQRASYDTLLFDEARLAARLQHPNIVQTFEVATDAGVPYLAMEYLDGQPFNRVLSAVSRAGDGIPIELALLVLCDVLSALEYAHDLTDFDGTPLGIVHRDVSPQNIFLTYQGEVKLVDFGVAKHAFSSDQTGIGIIKGKLTYMAPEQAQHATLDRRADIFAVGVVMWECLAMRRLLAAETPAATLKKLLYETLPGLGSERPDLDRELVAICDRALAREPEQRYPTAATMRAELENYLGPRRPTRADLANFVSSLFEAERRTRADQIKDVMSGDVALNVSEIDRTQREFADLGTGAREVAQALPTARASTLPPADARGSAPREEARRALLRAVLALALVLVALNVALVWAHWNESRPPPLEPHASATSATNATSGVAFDAAPEIVLRLCGSNTIGAELAPALVEAFLGGLPDANAVRRHAGAADATPAAPDMSKPGVGHPAGAVDSMIVSADFGKRRVGVSISARGSATAFVGLGDGSCDVGMASRAIDDGEAAQLAQRGYGELRSPATEHVIALDGIAVIVHPANPLRSLDRGALHDIFTGKIGDWSALGLGAEPIHVLARDDMSGTFDTFKHLVLRKDRLASAAQRFSSSELLSDAVASDPAAIGFVGIAYVRAARAIALGERGAAPLMPTQFTVATEGYMLSRRLYLYTLPKPRTAWVPDLISFALSPRAQDVAVKSQFVDLGLITRTAQCDGLCPTRYASTIAGAQRVSLDFRFRSGSDRPDSRAERDFDRLVSFLRAHRDAKLRLLGFSDALGDAGSNLKLSVDRAKAIEQELAMRGVLPDLVTGFGSAMPLADNDTDEGRQRNRRVEVWVEL